MAHYKSHKNQSIWYRKALAAFKELGSQLHLYRDFQVNSLYLHRRIYARIYVNTPIGEQPNLRKNKEFSENNNWVGIISKGVHYICCTDDETGDSQSTFLDIMFNIELLEYFRKADIGINSDQDFYNARALLSENTDEYWRLRDLVTKKYQHVQKWRKRNHVIRTKSE